MQVINYNELENYLIENKDCIIYSSFLDDAIVREFEIKFKDMIVRESLRNNILYLDLTSELNDTKKIKKLKETYQFEETDITNLPSITIFKDGEIVSMYSVKDDDYDIDKVEEYLEQEGIIDD